MKKIIFFIATVVIHLTIHAQVAVNSSGNNPDASAMLDIQATDKGLLIPRMSASDRDNISSPATGLTVFVTDDNHFYYYNGSQWVDLSDEPDNDWQISGNDMYSIPSGNVGIGTTSPAGKLHVVSTNAYMLFNYDRLSLRYTANNSHYPYIEWRDNNGNRGMFLGWGTPGNLIDMRMENGAKLNIAGGYVGINNSSPQYQLDVVNTDASRVGSFVSNRTSSDDVAVYGEVANTDYYGIGGEFIGGWMGVMTYVFPSGSNSYYGLHSYVSGGTGTNYGVYAYTSGDNGVTNYSVYGITSAPSDKGSGGFFANDDDTGIGIHGIGNNVSTYWYTSDGAGIIGNGTYYGTIGFTGYDDNSAVGVYGAFTEDTQTDATGVFGYSMPADYYGYGVKGYGGWMGVYGYTDDNGYYAVFANGDLGASGNKSFVIDDPRDPANKILKHFSIESNEVLNVYRGTVQLDRNGEAEVQMPSYFKVINRNFSYQLTPIGQAAPGLYVAREIGNGNSFRITGGNPGQKISWTVYAERNDPYLQQHPERRRVEIEKSSKERGKYIRPELYGQPEEKGMFYTKIPEIKKAKVPAPETDKKLKHPVKKSH